MNQLLATMGTHPPGVVGGAIPGALVGFVGGLAADPEVDVSEQDRFWPRAALDHAHASYGTSNEPKQSPA